MREPVGVIWLAPSRYVSLLPEKTSGSGRSKACFISTAAGSCMQLRVMAYFRFQRLMASNPVAQHRHE
jgi:hypothetical protein